MGCTCANKDGPIAMQATSAAESVDLLTTSQARLPSGSGRLRYAWDIQNSSISGTADSGKTLRASPNRAWVFHSRSPEKGTTSENLSRHRPPVPERPVTDLLRTSGTLKRRRLALLPARQDRFYRRRQAL